MTLKEEAAKCAELAAAYVEVPLGLYVCRCKHEHAPDQVWCYICEYPTRDRFEQKTRGPEAQA